MKKQFLIVLLSIFHAASACSQEINLSKDGYIQVIDSKLKQKDIHSKLKEWAAINFNKSEEIINFDSEEKIILKVVIPFEYKMYDRSMEKNNVVMCHISSDLIFSVRDYKFKIDFTPKDIATKNSYLVAERWFYEQLITPQTWTKDEYIANRKSSDVDRRTLNEYYSNYVKNKQHFDEIVDSLYSSIGSKVNTKDEW